MNMNKIYLEKEMVEECESEDGECFVMQVGKTPESLGFEPTGPYVDLNWFVSEVNRMAEDRMLKTGVLEGAHYNAMKSLVSKLTS